MLRLKCGNIHQELQELGEEAGEGTEIQSVTLFKLMKTFEKVMKRVNERNNKPQHVVFKYNYTMEESREYMLETVRTERSMGFEKIFETCQNRIHAIFLFLGMLELVQAQYFQIMIGEGMNNFIIEWNDERPTELAAGWPVITDPELN